MTGAASLISQWAAPLPCVSGTPMLARMTAPVVPTPQRNRLGIAALVLTIVALAAPVVTFIVVTIAASIEGAEGDDLGYAMLAGWFIGAGAASVVSPIAIVALVLGIVALTRRGTKKVQAILAVIFSVVPALFAFGLPTVIDLAF